MTDRLIPADGVNLYADHPGFDVQGCSLQHTVTQRGAYGGVRGGFGCLETGGHCVPDSHCDARREREAHRIEFRKSIVQGEPHHD